ncbi:MAG: hypothetical protein M3Y86_11815, partial [Verrucomicrobiota bacterium]|nr:hypothetical protein [Verrucomicrobiota bacterium]
ETDLSSIAIVGPVTLNGGVLSGTGVIDGALSFNGGYISPGNSPGLIDVTGNYSQGSGATLIVEAAGGEADQFDRLQIGGSAALNGTIRVRTINGYVPLENDPFVPVGASSFSGAFSSSSANVQLTMTSTGVVAVLNPSAPNPILGQPINISTRAQVLDGDSVMIGGFTITGSTSKNVLLRAIGPSLADYKVNGPLADPTLALFDTSGRITSNDDWKINDDTHQSQEASIPEKLRPTRAAESVIIATLAPNHLYTAIVRGKDGGTGVALVEAYDMDTGTTAILSNISTRGVVGTDDNVMIGGFMVAESGPAKVVVRGLGPSLTQFGVAGALQDPVLRIFDSNGNELVRNDDWNTDQAAELTALGRAPEDPREPAIVKTLTPGSYTAILNGKDGSTGVGLVEVFSVQ